MTQNSINQPMSQRGTSLTDEDNLNEPAKLAAEFSPG